MLLSLVLTIYSIIRKMMSTFLLVTIAVVLFNIYIGAMHLEGLIVPIDTSETLNLLKDKSVKILNNTVTTASNVVDQAIEAKTKLLQQLPQQPQPPPHKQQKLQPEVVESSLDISIAPLSISGDVPNNTVIDTIIDKVAQSAIAKVEKSIESAVNANNNKAGLSNKDVATAQLESFDMAEIMAMNNNNTVEGFCDYDSSD